MPRIFFYSILVCQLVTACNDGPETGTAVAEEREKVYSSRGDSIVRITFDTLRAALLGTMREKGPVAAMEYCNVNAYPLTALYAQNGISVKRTSEKSRNPGNAPDSLEMTVLKEFTLGRTGQRELKDTVLFSGDAIHYFKPILLQSVCRTCHGDPSSDIPPLVLDEIKKRYPADQATGFKEGDLRGAWHVRFPTP
jgi:hypothetical protein